MSVELHSSAVLPQGKRHRTLWVGFWSYVSLAESNLRVPATFRPSDVGRWDTETNRKVSSRDTSKTGLRRHSTWLMQWDKGTQEFYVDSSRIGCDSLSFHRHSPLASLDLTWVIQWDTDIQEFYVESSRISVTQGQSLRLTWPDVSHTMGHWYKGILRRVKSNQCDSRTVP
jgi:hypothetical protein